MIEDSEFAVEVIKEGFTLEFMKNALIKPVLSLRNKQLLLDWWKRVEEGEADVPLPPESEIFKSDNYSSFIYLYFKMATEVNVFAHLGKTLFTHMKESLFSDAVEEESDDENEDFINNDEVSKDENQACGEEANGDTETVETSNHSSDKDNEEEKDCETAKVIEPEPSRSEEKPKTITSMYGKVYTLKQ